MEDVSPTQVRVKSNADLTQAVIRKVVKGDFDAIWPMLQQAQKQPVIIGGQVVKVAERRNYPTNKEIEKVIGLDPQTGKQIAEFAIGDGDTYGTVAIDTDPSRFPAVLAQKGYIKPTPENKKVFRTVYAVDATYNSISGLGIQGYWASSNDQIKGDGVVIPQDWKLIDDVNASGEFLKALAVDDAGDETMHIVPIPGMTNVYQIDIIDFDKGTTTTYSAVKDNSAHSYMLGESLSTFTIYKGDDLKAAVDEFNASRDQLSRDIDVLHKYGLDSTYEEALSKIAPAAASREIVSGKLAQTHNGSYVIYRIKGDVLARIIAQKNENGTWQLNFDWDKRGFANKSIIVWQGQILSGNSSSKAKLLADLDNKPEVKASLKEEFKKAQNVLKPDQITSLEDVLRSVGVALDTDLIKVTVKSYDKEGISTGKVRTVPNAGDNKVQDNELYLAPGDPWGRVLAEKRYTADGYILIVNMWNWADKQGKDVPVKDVPVGIVPGSITIEVRDDGDVFAGDIKTFDGERNLNGMNLYFYKDQNANFKLGEYWTHGGQLYREDYAKKVSLLVASFASGEERIYYDLKVPYRSPYQITDEQGVPKGDIDSIKYKDGKEIQQWTMHNNGLLDLTRRFTGLFSKDESSFRVYDTMGKSVQYPFESFTSVFASVVFKGILVLAALFPIALILRALWTGRQRAKMMKRYVDGEGNVKPFSKKSVLPASDVDDSHERMRLYVLLVEDNLIGKIAKHDISGLFMSSIRQLYAEILAWYKTFDEKQGKTLNLLGSDPRLQKVDKYFQEFFRYIGGEYSREREGNEQSLYPEFKGLVDEEIMDKAHGYAYQLLHLLRKDMDNFNQGNVEAKKDIEGLLQKYGITGGRFILSHYRAFAESEGQRLFSFEVKQFDNNRVVRKQQFKDENLEGAFDILIQEGVLTKEKGSETDARITLEANLVEKKLEGLFLDVIERQIIVDLLTTYDHEVTAVKKDKKQESPQGESKVWGIQKWLNARWIWQDFMTLIRLTAKLFKWVLRIVKWWENKGNVQKFQRSLGIGSKGNPTDFEPGDPFLTHSGYVRSDHLSDV